MGLEFTQRSFVFAPGPVSVGLRRFITGEAAQVDGAVELPLPEWLPDQVFITRVLVSYSNGRQDVEVSGPPVNVSIIVATDPMGIAVASQADLSRAVSIIRGLYTANSAEAESQLNVPVVWDRAYGDRLVIQVDTDTALVTLRCEIDFLVPAGTQPTGPKSGY